MIKNNKKRLMFLFTTFIMLTTSLLATVGQSDYTVEAEDNPVNRILCRFEDGRTLVNMYSTDYLHYLTRSKSALTSTQEVDSSWLNKMLTVAGFDFITPNEVILGREIRPQSIDEDLEMNKGPKVSAFDRFGLSGLKWSSYLGEWKYYNVDACAPQTQVSPTSYGSFYKDRLEPKTTYNETSTSRDPRTVQFDKMVMNSIGRATADLIANVMLSITKAIVGLTIVFVGLAFTDITTLIGLSADGTAGTSAASIFSDIFNSVFSGFVLITFLFTAIYLVYMGIFKRQLRMALNTLIKTIVIFIVAIIMASNPSYWVGIPNKIATYGQALVVSSMSGMYDNDTSQPNLCSTDVASIGEGVDIDIKDGSSILSEFEKVNINMRSMIGCQMWEQLLFKPWVRGQFGAEYEDLHADKLNNINSSWVGEASVPIGDGQTIDNWALFHLSTQTNVHSQLGESNFPTKINGVNADWWRIVDALSNYDEAEVTDSITSEGGLTIQNNYIDQVNSDPLIYWQSWIGNNSAERMGTAIIGMFFGIMGSAAPFVFSLSSAVFGLGITLLMVVSPIFLLFGTWGGKGQSIFNGWLSALTNVVIKRIGVSVLLILSIGITMSVMNLAYTIGIVKSFILMILVTLLLIKNKDKMLNMLASVDLGGAFNPTNKASQLWQRQKRSVKNAGKIGLATVSGAKAGFKTGQGMMVGARIGSRNQLRNTLYQSQFGARMIAQYDIVLKHEATELQNCVICYMTLGEDGEEIAYRDDEGNYYCMYCADEVGIEKLGEVVVGSNKKEDEENPITRVRETRTEDATNNNSWLSHQKTVELMDPEVDNGKFYWNDDNVQKMIKDNIRALRKDIVTFSNMFHEFGIKSRPPAPPEPLQGYIDIALINQAWTDGRIDVVENTYKEAWKMWYEENSRFVEGMTEEHIEDFKKEIENYEPNISYEESLKLLNSRVTEKNASKFRNKDLYIYRNGKLVLNIFELDVDHEERHKDGNEYTENDNIEDK